VGVGSAHITARCKLIENEIKLPSGVSTSSNEVVVSAVDYSAKTIFDPSRCSCRSLEQSDGTTECRRNRFEKIRDDSTSGTALEHRKSLDDLMCLRL
jgi:hypothetical protein